jgi:hypothetical protein
MRKCVVIAFACLAVGMSASLSAQTEVWRHYSGALNKTIKIEADLLFSEESISGFYFYDKVGKPIELSGGLNAGRIAALSERDEAGKATGSMNGSFGKDFASFSGTWKSPDGSKSFPVSLSEDYSASAGLDAFTILREEALDPEADASPAVSYFGRALAVRGRPALQRAIEAAFYGGGDGRAWQESTARDFMADYKESAGELYAEEPEAESLNWEMSQTLAPVFNARGILSLQAGFYEYSGGAHPNGGSAYGVFDLASGRRLGLEAFVRGGASDALAAAVTAAFKKSAGLAAEASLGELGLSVDRLEVSEHDFYVDGEGIYFYFPAYSVGPYALGENYVFISWKDLGALSAGHPVGKPR